jgi:hypothetical protein
MLSEIVEVPFTCATAVPNVHDDPEGSPAQPKVSGLLKPFVGVMVRVVLAL